MFRIHFENWKQMNPCSQVETFAIDLQQYARRLGGLAGFVFVFYYTCAVPMNDCNVIRKLIE